jgi:hypothetical protein
MHMSIIGDLINEQQFIMEQKSNSPKKENNVDNWSKGNNGIYIYVYWCMYVCICIYKNINEYTCIII